jgi:hypothetical protein
MKEPVLLSDGHTYELTAIESWLAKNDTSPMTGGKLEHKNVRSHPGVTRGNAFLNLEDCPRSRMKLNICCI